MKSDEGGQKIQSGKKFFGCGSVWRMKWLSAVLLFAVAAPAPEEVVRTFYERIVLDKPLGIPEGATKDALWPLMTPRLVKVLDDARACEAEYMRNRGNSDEKPEFWWLEDGLFSGANEMALPARVEVLTTEKIDANTSRVIVRFTYEDSPTDGRAPNLEASFQWRSEMRVVCDAQHCLVDDFTPYDTDGGKLTPLSQSFSSFCNGRHPKHSLTQQ